MTSYDSIVPTSGTSLVYRDQVHILRGLPVLNVTPDSELENQLNLTNPYVFAGLMKDLVSYGFEFGDDFIHSKAKKMLSCGSPMVYECNDCGSKVMGSKSCDTRICPRCNRRRFKRLLKRYSPILSAMMHPRFMTLTLKNPEFLLKDSFQEFRRLWNLLRRHKYYRVRILGGIYAMEVTFTENGWNLHMHILYDGSFIPQDKLSKDWKSLTGSHIVDIRQAKKNTVCEIIGYSTKNVKLPNVHAYAEYLHAVDTLKLFQSFGKFYNYGSFEARLRVCAVCGGSSWKIHRSPDIVLLHEVDPSTYHPPPDMTVDLDDRGTPLRPMVVAGYG